VSLVAEDGERENFHRSVRALPAARGHAGRITRRYDIAGHTLNSRLCRVPAPPDGLLVWADWVAHPELFIDAYIKARPHAYAELLGRADGTMSFDEHISELRMHLRLLVTEDSRASATAQEYSWSNVKELTLDLRGPHFVLTARAIAMLDRNPYPKPDRMLTHLQGLSQLAFEYHETSGNLGGRIADIGAFEVNRDGVTAR
jgi:hypothetical protein